jgi:hypothetical protein
MPFKRLAVVAQGRIRPSGLRCLLEQAELAPQGHRHRLREPIAEHGTAALDAVRPWLADRKLCSFAISVVVSVGNRSHRSEAMAVLSDARADSPHFVRAQLNAALLALDHNVP